MIAFIGSVFSPYYAWARRTGNDDPENFCALNAVLYGDAGKRWAMTERGRPGLDRSRDHLDIGRSAMRWEGHSLVVDINEVTVPFPRRIVGQVRLTPGPITNHAVVLDARGQHVWWPIAPCARVEVDLEKPELSWSGDAYLDHNAGDEPLERGFRNWHWSRATDDGGTTILYDLVPRETPAEGVALRFDRATGESSTVDAPHSVELPRTLWQIDRRTRTALPGAAGVEKTLEDTPFYARSLIRTRLGPQEVTAVHETLSLDRFANPWVQAMLPFRMPRRRR
ncbi:carotenoid 1,2-hydratase [Natronocella acetinitrilica]|uniref:Carotenoid 1,2-hydratase n=1 Tax=Natronocella acetinitrilica TaxID=414046 RepID=A0AAE3G4V0_9GAMM|nr:carotenoid 1,2-hydratase [Natronocella acetinitrilica]